MAEEIQWTNEVLGILTQSVAKNSNDMRAFLTVNDVIPAVLGVNECADTLDVSPRTVQLDWRMARLQLKRLLEDAGAP